LRVEAGKDAVRRAGQKFSWDDATILAQSQSRDSLLGFVRALISEIKDEHSIERAAVAAGIAAVSAIVRSYNPGAVTVDLATVGMEIMAELAEVDGPFHILLVGRMLRPDTQLEFEKTVTASESQWLKQAAKDRLAADVKLTEAERLHLTRIAAGRMPFGFAVTGD
jgi:hypothetical protein